MVFDGAAKKEGFSLNHKIHCGPKLQEDLFGVLPRSRRNQIAVNCDISEIYL